MGSHITSSENHYFHPVFVIWFIAKLLGFKLVLKRITGKECVNVFVVEFYFLFLFLFYLSEKTKTLGSVQLQ